MSQLDFQPGIISFCSGLNGRFSIHAQQYGERRLLRVQDTLLGLEKGKTDRHTVKKCGVQITPNSLHTTSVIAHYKHVGVRYTPFW